MGLLAAAFTTHAQTWQPHFEVPGSVTTALIDPFSVPTQPGIFFGGFSSRNAGCSVESIGPLGDAACSDMDGGAVNQLGYDLFSGRLYSVGSSPDGLWHVRESADAGMTWQTVDTYSGQANGYESDGNGNVFVCGSANDSSGYAHWIVRKRNSSGVWSTVRDWSERRKSYRAEKMHIANGYLFVVGSVGNADIWAVQRGNIASGIWDAPYTWAPKGKRAGAVAVTSRGTDIYVLGPTGGVTEAPEQCVLQRSGNNGAGAWQTVKTFAESIQYNRPRDLAFDAVGNLYVVGDSTFWVAAGTSKNSGGSYNNAWIVRRHAAADPITDNWQTWLPRGVPQNELSYAKTVSPDTFGNVFITGEAVVVPGFTNRRVIVQKWTP